MSTRSMAGWGRWRLIDELHRHKSPGLVWRSARWFGPRDGQLVTISTAGADQNNVLWRMRQAAIEMGV
jgi:hypothetical protein